MNQLRELIIAGHLSLVELRLLKVEAYGVLSALALALWHPRMAAPTRRWVWNTFNRVARRRRFAVMLCACLVLLLRCAALPWYPVPEPGVHDEFSYLLGADTFASGRITNPTHPMWQHFETFHVIHVPSYTSIYPPAQAAFLAAGKVMFGLPWAGVLLSAAAMAAAVCWMLQGWTPPSWALLGGILVALRLGSFGYWINSYWGGSVAALGGALTLGALGRIRRSQASLNGFIAGLGILLLANSRPLEGSILCGSVMIGLAIWRPETSVSKKLWTRQIVTPLIFMLVFGALLTSYYFWRVTGGPFVMPHYINQKMYAMSSPFIWQPAPSPPIYRHASMARLYRTYREEYEYVRSPLGFVERIVKKIVLFAAFFGSPTLWVALLASSCIVRNRKLRPLICVCLGQVAAVIVTIYFLPHYAAPAVSALCALALTGLRYLRCWRTAGRPTGALFTDMLLMLCACTLVIRAAMPPDVRAWPSERANLDRSLRASGQRHLIIVRYSDDHSPHMEWVYNDANIDASPVVWARDMGSAKNQELIDYFKDMNIWLLEPDRKPLRLIPYSSATDYSVWSSTKSVR